MRPESLKKSGSVTLLSVLCLVIGLALLQAGPAVAKTKDKYAALVMDVESGRVLFSRNASLRRYPASLTKIMTLYMTFEALEGGKITKNTAMKVSRNASRQPPSRLGLQKGQTITVDQAIRALVTKSANDVAVVLAEHLGGSEKKFAQMMTDQARRIGMRRTTFRNASGLPNRAQLSTARDMAKLGIAIRRDFPQHFDYFQTEKFRYRSRTHRSHNNLLGTVEGVDGIKTGYTHASGFNLVSSVERDGKRLVGVVFGGRTAKERDRHMRYLLELSYQKLAGLPVTSAVNIRPNSFSGRNRKFSAAPVPRLKPETAVVGKKTVPTLMAQDIPRPEVKPATEAVVEATEMTTSEPAAPAPATAVKITKVKPVSEIVIARSTEAGPDSDEEGAEGDIQQTEQGSANTRDWSVQVGAYSSYSRAFTEARKARKVLTNGELRTYPFIDRIGKGSNALFRTRLGGLSRDEAGEACGMLTQENLVCQVVTPENDSADNSS